MYKNSATKPALCFAPVGNESTIEAHSETLPAAFRVHHQTYTAHYTSLDLLQDESIARAYVYARAALAEAVLSSIVWTPQGVGVTRGLYCVVVFDKDISGHSLLRSSDPIWGILYLGRTAHQLKSEAQLVAYLMARFHTTQEQKGE